MMQEFLHKLAKNDARVYKSAVQFSAKHREYYRFLFDKVQLRVSHVDKLTQNFLTAILVEILRTVRR
jgi:hypothetical protein